MLSSDDEGGMDMDEETTEIESIIKLNMGVPVVLIANKSDLVHGPMTEFYKDKFDFIMRHLREHILMYGGTIMATSCLLYTSPSPRDQRGSRMPSSA